jgi:beta-phosphoglucomutase-like phosphatase (HAD superfamily)
MTEILEHTTELHFRIWTEFHTMPGLRLTLSQACRLFGGQPGEVIEALRDLVDASVLRQIGPYFVRADFGSFTA